ncbi:MAG: exodeoxyribonuclease VII large subunit [Clostridia bacterium]|nr:exodeoxyribonuclease VII large subunit [Clostridia bacterium]
MPENNPISVSTLNEYVKRLLDNDARLASVSVEGEISGFKISKGGHVFFSLKDKNALLRCVMFSSRVAALKTQLEDGKKIVANGSVSIYSAEGNYQMYVNSVRETGVGDLYKQFVELQQKLQNEGLFSRKRPIPFLPRCVGIITSEQGAVLHDIKSVISRRFPSMNMLFVPAKVQGSDAPRDLIRALEEMNSHQEPDVIIIGRGGGSFEELACFNDEALARAIFASRIPVISAVGHEVDFTIADFAADVRAATPSIAAEISVPELHKLKSEIAGKLDAIRAKTYAKLAEAKKHIAFIMHDSMLANPKLKLEMKRAETDKKRDLILRDTQAAIAAAYARLDNASASLSALDPFAVLKRGYAIVSDQDGKTITSSDMTSSGESVNIRFAQGAISAVVKDKNK